MTHSIKTTCFGFCIAILLGTSAHASAYTHIKGGDSISASKQCIGKRTQRSKSYAHEQWQEFDRSVGIARKLNKPVNAKDWAQARDLWYRCQRVRTTFGIGISGDARIGISIEH